MLYIVYRIWYTIEYKTYDFEYAIFDFRVARKKKQISKGQNQYGFTIKYKKTESPDEIFIETLILVPFTSF